MAGKNIAILGSTGSIGRQALEVVAQSQGALNVLTLAAGDNIDLLCEQIKKFQPKIVSIREKKSVMLIQEKFPEIEVLFGAEGLERVVSLPEIDIVLVAIVGVTALQPTITAIKLQKDIALASKEVLVAAGSIIIPLVQKYGVKLLPVDSEHSAIMQALVNNIDVAQGIINYQIDNIEKIILTASGGAFCGLSRTQLKDKKFTDALKHPNWEMGEKVTIDSATLMNKGLEVIEAHWLFGLPFSRIEVIVHPQSIVHSLVEYVDGSVLAQLAPADMRLPIQYALSYPQRTKADWPKLKLNEVGSLIFETPNKESFKCLQLAYQAGEAGGTMPAVLNAANEEAVELFKQNKIGFLEIAEIIERVLAKHQNQKNPDLAAIIAVDQWARSEIKNRERVLK